MNGVVLDSGSNLTMRMGSNDTIFPKLRLTSNGNLFIAGTLTTSHIGFSDDRLKTGEAPLQGALTTVLKLQSQTYIKQVPQTTEAYADKDNIQEMLAQPQYEAG